MEHGRTPPLQRKAYEHLSVHLLQDGPDIVSSCCVVIRYHAARMINFTRQIVQGECIAQRMDELYPIHAYNHHLNHQASYSLTVLGLTLLLVSAVVFAYSPANGDFILWFQCSALCFLLSAVTHIVLMYNPHHDL